MSYIREGIEVEYECGHKMVYDRYGVDGVPEVGEAGWCRSHNGVQKVTGLRQCWIEHTTTVHFERPETHKTPKGTKAA